MASATAPPTPVSISSNTSVGAEPRSASTTLSASRKRASSPPEATLISGPGRVPGLVCTQNSTRSMPLGPAEAASLSISVENRARSSLSGFSSAFTALSSFCAPLRRASDNASAALENCACASPAAFSSAASRSAPASISARSARIFRGQRVEVVDRRIVLAARGAQREQPLLDALQLLRVMVGRAQRLLEMAARLLERVEGRVERLHRRLQQAGRLRGAALQPAHRRRQRRHRRGAAGHGVVRLAQIARDLLALHHLGAALRQRGFFARLRGELGEFLDRVTQPVGLARRTLDIGAMVAHRGFGLAAGVPQPLDRGGVLLQARIGIEQAAMRRRIHQRARIMLAVDLDQRGAEILQRLHADRLIVDEGAGAAVGELHAAQDQRLVGLDVALGQQRARRNDWRPARTSRSPGPARRPGAPAWRRPARRAPARTHRAGSTCRRRSRR